MDAVCAEKLVHSYAFAGSKRRSLDGVSFTIKQGELVALLGHNGCGKTTLARHLNALLPVQSGELTVAGLDARGSANLWNAGKGYPGESAPRSGERGYGRV